MISVVIGSRVAAPRACRARGGFRGRSDRKLFGTDVRRTPRGYTEPEAGDKTGPDDFTR